METLFFGMVERKLVSEGYCPSHLLCKYNRWENVNYGVLGLLLFNAPHFLRDEDLKMSLLFLAQSYNTETREKPLLGGSGP